MITTSQARKIINDHVKAFTGIPQSSIQWTNQTDFKPPKDANWCRITVQYGDTFPSGLHNGILQRDAGIINIQCFTPKGHGDLSVIALADAWRAHFESFRKPFFEVTLRHAPTPIQSELDTDFVSTLIRIEFHVN